MSKVFEFDQTSIPGQFPINLLNNRNIDTDPEYTSDFFRTVLYTIAYATKLQKDKTPKAKKVGFIFKTLKGEFVFGSILSFHKTSEEDDSGNWYLEFTFDAEDMQDSDFGSIGDNHSNEYYTALCGKLREIMNATPRSVNPMQLMTEEMFSTIKNFLDVNASETEEVELVMPGVFTASIVVEDGKKYMSMVPGEAVKQQIKDDINLDYEEPTDMAMAA